MPGPEVDSASLWTWVKRTRARSPRARASSVRPCSRRSSESSRQKVALTARSHRQVELRLGLLERPVGAGQIPAVPPRVADEGPGLAGQLGKERHRHAGGVELPHHRDDQPRQVLAFARVRGGHFGALVEEENGERGRGARDGGALVPPQARRLVQLALRGFALAEGPRHLGRELLLEGGPHGAVVERAGAACGGCLR